MIRSLVFECFDLARELMLAKLRIIEVVGKFFKALSKH